ncbi:ankyrin repeat domain-containing protein [Wolbachia endosymbiont of Pentalonia nigronervosa]|uniref:ankyrin repeat domain-containing protein n=1 Tax=Wolbachia endosymbiont of Pentalonia nigronervosa TaxID=1301914 RepID=UPI00165FE359|nr:ankyrin repeat domain-containing protein [Wolbachia endosymbiont of Pentalonia nigronervosa]MBD0391581.1 ankyrin repeat domain-containing protein [Wolbachia endosymbiont of Pentalonia nigronervosa]
MYQVFYCEEFSDCALGDDKNPLRKKFNAIVKDLKENRHTNLGDVKLIKGDGGVKYFRAKLSDADRLLFTSIKYKKEGKEEDAFVILEVILNHEYNKSKFLKDKEKIKSIKIIEHNEDDKKIPDNIEIIDAPKIHWLGKFITFSAKQEDIVENAGGKYNLPLVVSGHAGSGKTSVALEKLRKIEEEGKILYITQSENLIKQLEELYKYEHWDEAAEELRTGDPERIDFLSVHEFLEKVTEEDVKGKKPIDRNVFHSWFKEECNKGKFKKYKKEGDKIFEEFTAVIAGGSLGREGGKEQYMKLGNRESIFPREEREKIYDLFEEYKKFIGEHSEYYDVSLIAHEYVEKADEVYDTVVVDEVQDLTRSTLKLILGSLKDDSKENFLLCGDVNQVIHPSFFSISRLKHFLSNIVERKEVGICVLEKNYRNSQQVIELANRILHFKNYCFASEDKIKPDKKETFFMKSDSNSKGTVVFINESEKQEEVGKKASRSVDWAVLALDDGSKEDVRRAFDTPLVFSMQEAKGLEFKNVILYKFGEVYNKLWNIVCPNKDKEEVERKVNEIRLSYGEENVNTSRTKDKEDESFERNKFYMNALYVAVTRAIDGVYIMDDKEQHNLLKVVVPGEEVNVVGTASIEEKESSLAEWRNMALDLINKGKIEQAVNIAKTRLLNEEEYVQEIINSLKAGGWDTEAEGISAKLQPSLGAEVSAEDASSKSPQKRSGGIVKSVTPTKKIKVDQNDGQSEIDNTTKHRMKRATAIDNKKVPNQKRARANQNERRDGGKGASISKQRHKQKEKLPKLKGGRKLTQIIRGDQEEEFEEKVKKSPDSVYQYGKEKLLDYALKQGSFKIAKYLIEQGASVHGDKEKNGSPLYLVLDCIVNCIVKGKIYGEDDLKVKERFDLCREIVQLIINKGFDVSNYKPQPGTTVLHHILETKENKDKVFPIFKLFVEGMASSGIDCKNNNLCTPLHIAAEQGFKDEAELLLKHRADINAKDIRGNTPLHSAIVSKCEGIIEVLLKNGADINANGIRHCTPLHVAVEQGYESIVELLLKHEKIDVNAKDEKGRTPLYFAVLEDYESIVELLLKHEKIDVNVRDNRGVTSLHVIAEKGNESIARLLLENKKIDVNVCAGERFGTALHKAAASGHKNIAALLLEHGADINAKPAGYCTPLCLATKKNCKDVVELLLSDANIDIYEDSFSEFLEKRKLNKTMQKLYDGKNKINREVFEAVQEAVQKKDEAGKKKIEKLLENGSGQFCPSFNYRTEEKTVITLNKDVLQLVFSYAAEKKIYVETVGSFLITDSKGEFLIGKDKVTKYSDMKGNTFLHLAAENNDSKMVEFLLKAGANVNARGLNDCTSLYIAAQEGNYDVVELLIGHEKIDVNARDLYDNSPLHVALNRGYSDIINLLLTDPNINVGREKVSSAKKKEDKAKILQKLNQDNKLFNLIKRAKKQADRSKIDELLGEIKELLELKSGSSFKPSLNYSPDGTDEGTTLKIALQTGNKKLLKLLYDYAEKNIGVDTEIFKQLRETVEQKEEFQLGSSLSGVSISRCMVGVLNKLCQTEK